MANPLVKIAVPLAGVAAAVIGNKVAEAGWGAVFGEDAPTEKTVKNSQKDAKKQRKQAKKEGQPKPEIEAIRDPAEDQPIWKALLWTLISGVVLQGIKLAAERGTRKGVDSLTYRRPRSNRG